MNKDTQPPGMLPVSVLLFLVLASIYMLRPPALLFWAYGLGMDDTSGPDGTSEPAPPGVRAPMQPIPVPKPLAEALPERSPGSTELMDLDAAIQKLTLAERTGRGKSVLEPDTALSQAAALHSEDMYRDDYLGHTSPEGVGPAERVGKAQRQAFGVVSENVAKLEGVFDPGLGNKFVQGWMNSPGHRRNLLADGPTHLGVGCFGEAVAGTKMSKICCTQLFLTAFAWTDTPVPAEVPADTSLKLALHAQEGKRLPTGISQVGLSNAQTVTSVELKPQGQLAVGELLLTGPPGVYRLEVHIPDARDATRFLIVPGPYVVVKQR